VHALGQEIHKRVETRQSSLDRDAVLV
jgi:hypothetical protein